MSAANKNWKCNGRRSVSAYFERSKHSSTGRSMFREDEVVRREKAPSVEEMLQNFERSKLSSMGRS